MRGYKLSDGGCGKIIGLEEEELLTCVKIHERGQCISYTRTDAKNKKNAVNRVLYAMKMYAVERRVSVSGTSYARTILHKSGSESWKENVFNKATITFERQ